MVFNIRYKLVKVILSIFFLLLISQSAFAQSGQKNNVLILNSYHNGFAWTDQQCTGIISALDSNQDTVRFVEYIDWKRYPYTENLRHLYDDLKFKYVDKKISVIITTDDAALKFALDNRKALFSNAPIVFGGVSEASATRLLENQGDVTGVYEANDTLGTAQIAKDMIPGLRKAYIIHDNSESGMDFYRSMGEAVSTVDRTIEQQDMGKYSIDEICKILKTLDKDSVVFYDSYSADAKGLTLGIDAFAERITENSSVPVFTPAESIVGKGCIGGSVLSGSIHGHDVGVLAVRILSGETAQSLPISTEKSVRYVFDYRQLKRFAISTDALPPNSNLINKPFSFYEAYKTRILMVAGVFIILVVLIFYLLSNIRLRKKVELKLRESYEEQAVLNEELTALNEEVMASEENLQGNYEELEKKQHELRLSEEKYRLVAEASMDIIWEADVNLNTRKFSSKLYDILGYANDEIQTCDDWYNVIHPDDIPIVKDVYASLGSGSFEKTKVQFRVRCKNGQYKWIHSYARPLMDECGNVVKVYGAYTDVTELKQQQMKINRLAYVDSITGLPNRISLQEKTGDIIAGPSTESHGFALYFIDIDDFKVVNDSYGHMAGDKLLFLVAERLKGINANGFEVFRLGGDEFILLYRNDSGSDPVKKMGDSILQALVEPFKIDDNIFYIRASIGIVQYPADGSTYDELLKNADNAMYKAKEAGKSRYEFYSESMGEEVLRKINMQNRLHEAVENNEFVLHYQPITRIDDGTVKGFEALVRWNHPTDGLIMPGEFIHVAEESGKIVDIGRWVLESACEFAKEIFDKGLRDFHMHVNVSVIQLYQRDFVDQLVGILRKTELPPEYLVVEITETVLMESFAQITATLNAIRSKGIRIALDDFGSGYSSLSYLKQLPIDTIKIDKTFISDVSARDDQTSIAGPIVNLVKVFGLDVIAEGVETTEQFEYLRQNGCEYIQGYLISKPMAKEPAIAFLHQTQSVELERAEELG